MPNTKPRPPADEESAPAAAAPVAPAPEKKPDESEPGGRFIVNGKLVNSEGQRIHEDGTLLSDAELAAEA